MLEQIGIVLLVSGVVLGMGVSSIPSLARGLQVGLLILALVLVAVGLFAIRKYRTKSS